MTASDERRHGEWLEGMYTRYLIACSVLIFTAFVAALILMDHVRLLAGNWAEEASGVTALALVTISAIVGAAACGVAAFMCRALDIGSRT